MLSIPFGHRAHHAHILATGADRPVYVQVRVFLGRHDGESVYTSACGRIVSQIRPRGQDGYEVELQGGRRRVALCSNVRACQGLDGRCVCAGEV